jgi:hypothetical protein
MIEAAAVSFDAESTSSPGFLDKAMAMGNAKCADVGDLPQNDSGLLPRRVRRSRWSRPLRRDRQVRF